MELRNKYFFFDDRAFALTGSCFDISSLVAYVRRQAPCRQDMQLLACMISLSIYLSIYLSLSIYIYIYIYTYIYIYIYIVYRMCPYMRTSERGRVGQSPSPPELRPSARLAAKGPRSPLYKLTHPYFLKPLGRGPMG